MKQNGGEAATAGGFDAGDERAREALPCEPIFAYAGGKRAVAKQIAPLIDFAPHKTYAEPFFGAGGLFFARRRRPPLEVINDKDGELINLCRQAQKHPEYLIAEIEKLPPSRALFYQLKAAAPQSLTELERAARALYLHINCFGGKSRVQNFAHNGLNRAPRWRADYYAAHIRQFCARMKETVIECQDWRGICAMYDGAQTLFYLDPPYYGSENYYRESFPRADFAALAEFMRAAKGFCLLSINSCAETDAIFSGFASREIKHIYTINKEDNSSEARERLYMNNRLAVLAASKKESLLQLWGR